MLKIIKNLMSKQPIAGERNKDVKKINAENKLIELGTPTNSKFFNVYKNFFCDHIIYNSNANA